MLQHWNEYRSRNQQNRARDDQQKQFLKLHFHISFDIGLYTLKGLKCFEMDPIVIEQREDFREHLTLGLVSAIGRLKTQKQTFSIEYSRSKKLSYCWCFFDQ